MGKDDYRYKRIAHRRFLTMFHLFLPTSVIEQSDLTRGHRKLHFSICPHVYKN